MAAHRYVITGAASGIGRSVATLAAGSGGDLCLVDRNARDLEDIADLLRAAGHRIETIVADLSDPDVPPAVIEHATSALGGLDVLISNVGLPVIAPLAELSVEEFDLSFAVNTRAHWLLGKAAHRWLKESRGSIVATASLTGWHPAPPLGAYSVSKAALLMLVKQMALEWGPDGIRCNSVSPGPTLTGMTRGIFNDMDDPAQRAMRQHREAHLPLQKLGTADEVAQVVLFLAGPLASRITGVDVLVDSGMSLSLMPATGGGTGQSTTTSTA